MHDVAAIPPPIATNQARQGEQPIFAVDAATRCRTADKLAEDRDGHKRADAQGRNPGPRRTQPKPDHHATGHEPRDERVEE